MSAPVRLLHREVLAVTGPDAEPFLQGLLTNDVLGMAPGARRYAALLTAQGKVIADFLLERGDPERSGEGYLIDCAAAAGHSLLKRLRMFRLRAAVAVDERPDLAVIAFAGAPDPRSPNASARAFAARLSDAADDPAAYHSARISAGLPEQGIDFGVEDVFPADINMDVLNGVDFRKGCFVGQEVVSRMKRRGTARRRTIGTALPLAAPDLPCPILANGLEIGVLTSAAGRHGLARVRIDRMAQAAAAGHSFSVGDLPLNFEQPSWMAEEIAALDAPRGERA
ncbi:MAG: folate-binding protein [Alphaproteobacteria bacterium]|nr:folate-binding protein [Alphaproteobacteria bacterium]